MWCKCTYQIPGTPRQSVCAQDRQLDTGDVLVRRWIGTMAARESPKRWKNRSETTYSSYRLFKLRLGYFCRFWWPGMTKIPWWLAKIECWRGRFRDYAESCDGIVNDRIRFLVDRRARHKSQESILERWQTEFQKNWESIFEDFRIPWVSKSTVKEEFVLFCSFDLDSYDYDVER